MTNPFIRPIVLSSENDAGLAEQLNSLRVHEAGHLRLKAVIKSPDDYSLEQIRMRVDAVTPKHVLGEAVRQESISFSKPVDIAGAASIEGVYELLVQYALGHERNAEPIVAAIRLSLKAFSLPAYVVLDEALVGRLVDGIRSQPEMAHRIAGSLVLGAQPPRFWFDPHFRMPAGGELTVAHDSLGDRCLRVGNLSTVYRSFMYGDGLLVCTSRNALPSEEGSTRPSDISDSCLGYQVWDHHGATPWIPFEKSRVVVWSTGGRTAAGECSQSSIQFQMTQSGLKLTNIGSYEVEIALKHN